LKNQSIAKNKVTGIDESELADRHYYQLKTELPGAVELEPSRTGDYFQQDRNTVINY
jgi:hypothetical protein